MFLIELCSSYSCTRWLSGFLSLFACCHCCIIHLDTYLLLCFVAVTVQTCMLRVVIALRFCHAAAIVGFLAVGLRWQQSRSWFVAGAKQDSSFGLHIVCDSCLSGCSLPTRWKTWSFLWRSEGAQGRLSYWYSDNEALCRYQQSIRSCLSQANTKSWTDATLALWREMRYREQAMW